MRPTEESSSFIHSFPLLSDKAFASKKESVDEARKANAEISELCLQLQGRAPKQLAGLISSKDYQKADPKYAEVVTSSIKNIWENGKRLGIPEELLNNLHTFCSRLLDSANDNFYGNQYPDFYFKILLNLAIIEFKTRNDKIADVNEGREIIKKLCADCMVCSGGVFAHVGNAALQLNTSLTISSQLCNMRYNLVMEFAAQHCSRKGIPEISEIHVANILVTHANNLGFNVGVTPEDTYAADQEITKVDDDDLQQFQDFLRKYYTLPNILKYLVEQIRSRIFALNNSSDLVRENLTEPVAMRAFEEKYEPICSAFGTRITKFITTEEPFRFIFTRLPLDVFVALVGQEFCYVDAPELRRDLLCFDFSSDNSAAMHKVFSALIYSLDEKYKNFPGGALVLFLLYIENIVPLIDAGQIRQIIQFFGSEFFKKYITTIDQLMMVLAYLQSDELKQLFLTELHALNPQHISLLLKNRAAVLEFLSTCPNGYKSRLLQIPLWNSLRNQINDIATLNAICERFPAELINELFNKLGVSFIQELVAKVDLVKAPAEIVEVIKLWKAMRACGFSTASSVNYENIQRQALSLKGSLFVTLADHAVKRVVDKERKVQFLLDALQFILNDVVASHRLVEYTSNDAVFASIIALSSRILCINAENVQSQLISILTIPFVQHCLIENLGFYSHNEHLKEHLLSVSAFSWVLIILSLIHNNNVLLYKQLDLSQLREFFSLSSCMSSFSSLYKMLSSKALQRIVSDFFFDVLIREFGGKEFLQQNIKLADFLTCLLRCSDDDYFVQKAIAAIGGVVGIQKLIKNAQDLVDISYHPVLKKTLTKTEKKSLLTPALMESFVLRNSHQYVNLSSVLSGFEDADLQEDFLDKVTQYNPNYILTAVIETVNLPNFLTTCVSKRYRMLPFAGGAVDCTKEYIKDVRMLFDILAKCDLAEQKVILESLGLPFVQKLFVDIKQTATDVYYGIRLIMLLQKNFPTYIPQINRDAISNYLNNRTAQVTALSNLYAVAAKNSCPKQAEGVQFLVDFWNNFVPNFFNDQQIARSKSYIQDTVSIVSKLIGEGKLPIESLEESFIQNLINAVGDLYQKDPSLDYQLLFNLFLILIKAAQMRDKQGKSVDPWCYDKLKDVFFKNAAEKDAAQVLYKYQSKLNSIAFAQEAATGLLVLREFFQNMVPLLGGTTFLQRIIDTSEKCAILLSMVPTAGRAEVISALGGFAYIRQFMLTKEGFATIFDNVILVVGERDREAIVREIVVDKFQEFVSTLEELLKILRGLRFPGDQLKLLHALDAKHSAWGVAFIKDFKSLMEFVDVCHSKQYCLNFLRNNGLLLPKYITKADQLLQFLAKFPENLQAEILKQFGDEDIQKMVDAAVFENEVKKQMVSQEAEKVIKLVITLNKLDPERFAKLDYASVDFAFHESRFNDLFGDRYHSVSTSSDEKVLLLEDLVAVLLNVLGGVQYLKRKHILMRDFLEKIHEYVSSVRFSKFPPDFVQMCVVNGFVAYQKKGEEISALQKISSILIALHKADKNKKFAGLDYKELAKVCLEQKFLLDQLRKGQFKSPQNDFFNVFIPLIGGADFVRQSFRTIEDLLVLKQADKSVQEKIIELLGGVGCLRTYIHNLMEFLTLYQNRNIFSITSLEQFWDALGKEALQGLSPSVGQCKAFLLQIPSPKERTFLAQRIKEMVKEFEIDEEILTCNIQMDVAPVEVARMQSQLTMEQRMQQRLTQPTIPRSEATMLRAKRAAMEQGQAGQPPRPASVPNSLSAKRGVVSAVSSSAAVGAAAGLAPTASDRAAVQRSAMVAAASRQAAAAAAAAAAGQANAAAITTFRQANARNIPQTAYTAQMQMGIGMMGMGVGGAAPAGYSGAGLPPLATLIGREMAVAGAVGRMATKVVKAAKEKEAAPKLSVADRCMLDSQLNDLLGVIQSGDFARLQEIVAKNQCDFSKYFGKSSDSPLREESSIITFHFADNIPLSNISKTLSIVYDRMQEEKTKAESVSKKTKRATHNYFRQFVFDAGLFSRALRERDCALMRLLIKNGHCAQKQVVNGYYSDFKDEFYKSVVNITLTTPFASEEECFEIFKLLDEFCGIHLWEEYLPVVCETSNVKAITTLRTFLDMIRPTYKFNTDNDTILKKKDNAELLKELLPLQSQENLVSMLQTLLSQGDMQTAKVVRDFCNPYTTRLHGRESLLFMIVKAGWIDGVSWFFRNNRGFDLNGRNNKTLLLLACQLPEEKNPAGIAELLLSHAIRGKSSYLKTVAKDKNVIENSAVVKILQEHISKLEKQEAERPANCRFFPSANGAAGSAADQVLSDDEYSADEEEPPQPVARPRESDTQPNKQARLE